MFNFFRKKKKDSKNIKSYLLDKETNFSIIESYKTARLNMMFSKAAGSKKAFVFSSCLSSEGKTTTCINMAIAFAETDAKVLLIDADLRKSNVHKIFEVENEKGLSTILGNLSGFKESVVPSKIKNLDILPAGPTPPNPIELLATEKMAKLIKEAEGIYDYIMIDTPPINIVSDALHLNNHTAGIIFVLYEGITSHFDIKKALKNIKLTEGKVLGFIKVGCKPLRSKYYYKEYYEYKV